MRFYRVQIEATGLGLGDELHGFIANRYVLARNQDDAERRALVISRQVWAKRRPELSCAYPIFEITETEAVGVIHALKSLPQNHAHIFYGRDA